MMETSMNGCKGTHVLIRGILLASLAFSPLAFAQSADELKALRSDIQGLRETQALRNDLQALKESQTAIQKELQEIKTLLQAVRQAPPTVAAAAPAAAPAQAQNVVLATDGSAFKGNKDAKVTVVEFTDYQCPFCSRYTRDTFPEIEKEYIKTGKIKYVLREFPLESIHPLAFKAAEGAQCAGEQGKYWEMHDRLFADQKLIGVKDLPKHAEALGLDGAKFQSCLDSGKHSKTIRKDMADGQLAGATGTPTFFVGETQPNGSMKVVSTLKGAQPFFPFKVAIDKALGATP
jgi:protein-disulfide isomerase